MFKKVSAILAASALLCSTVAIEQSDARGGSGGKRGGSSKSYSSSSYKPTTAATTKKNVTYKNCTEARAAGVTPIYKGQPGYALKLDRDKDGIACE